MTDKPKTDTRAYTLSVVETRDGGFLVTLQKPLHFGMILLAAGDKQKSLAAIEDWMDGKIMEGRND